MGPRRDCDPAELSPRRHRGAAEAPIDAPWSIAHLSLVATSGHTARRRRPRIRAGARAHVARRLAKVPDHSLADGGPGEVDAGDDEPMSAARAVIMMTQAFHVWNQ